MIDVEISTRLLGAPAVSAIVGDRVFPLRAPTGAALPFARWQRIGRVLVGDEALDAPPGLYRARVQIDACAETYTEARALGDAIFAALSGWGDPVAGVVRHAVFDGDRDLDDTDPAAHRAGVSQDWFITFEL